MRDEGSAVAGSTNYTLICTITLPMINAEMPTVEWTLPSSSLIDETGSNGDNIYYTRLPLSPLTHEDEGEYTCSAYYTVAGVRAPTMERDYYVTVRTPDTTDNVSMTVAVMGSGSGEVGSLYTLTCTVTLSHRASDSSVSIQWQGPAGLSHTDDDDDDDSTDNRVVVSELSLNPLTLGHGGDYTCTAEYTVDGETTIGSGNRTLNVLSKLAILYMSKLGYLFVLYIIIL